MKTLLALMAAVLVLGLFSPAEAQAGHRCHYPRHYNSRAAIVQNLLYLGARSQSCAPSPGYYYPRITYRYYSYPRYYAAPVYYRGYPYRYYYRGYRCRY